MEDRYKLYFRNALSKYGEKKIGEYYVDGYNKKYDWAVEANGCWYISIRSFTTDSNSVTVYLPQGGTAVPDVIRPAGMFTKRPARDRNMSRARSKF